MATLGDVRSVFINLKKGKTVNLISKREKTQMILNPVEGGINVKEDEKEVTIPINQLEEFLKTHRLDWTLEKVVVD
jgi:hypothetical protein